MNICRHAKTNGIHQLSSNPSTQRLHSDPLWVCQPITFIDALTHSFITSSQQHSGRFRKSMTIGCCLLFKLLMLFSSCWSFDPLWKNGREEVEYNRPLLIFLPCFWTLNHLISKKEVWVKGLGFFTLNPKHYYSIVLLLLLLLFYTFVM